MLLDLSKPWIIKKFAEVAEIGTGESQAPAIWKNKRTPKEIEDDDKKFKAGGYDSYLLSAHIQKWTKGQFYRVNTNP